MLVLSTRAMCYVLNVDRCLSRTLVVLRAVDSR